MKKREVKWLKSGYLLAIESPSGDMIVQGVLDGSIDPNHLQTPAPGQLLLAPVPFVLDCNGINGQFACADIDGHPLSKADAIARGWKDIEFDPYALGASYMGTCPKCQAESRNCKKTN